MSELQANHNHPVVFRRSRPEVPVRQSQGMSDETYKRIQLVMLQNKQPRAITEEWGTYITRLAKKLEMDPAKADLFLRGALYRKDL